MRRNFFHLFANKMSFCESGWHCVNRNDAAPKIVQRLVKYSIVEGDEGLKVKMDGEAAAWTAGGLECLRPAALLYSL